MELCFVSKAKRILTMNMPAKALLSPLNLMKFTMFPLDGGLVGLQIYILTRNINKNLKIQKVVWCPASVTVVTFR